MNWVMLAFVAAATSCGSEVNGTDGNTTEIKGSSIVSTPRLGNSVSGESKKAVANASLQLAAPAGAAALIAVRGAASGMSDVSIMAAQSFRVMEGGRQVATFVAGEGKSARAVYAGCFAAIVQDHRVSIVPTVGSGNWEAETCGSALAVGIFASGDPALIGIVYEASSPNAELTEPIILRWRRNTGALSIDEPLSKRASLKGAVSIAAMRRLAR